MVQGQVLITWIQIDINLLEPAQEVDHGKNVLLYPEPKPWKNIFENKINIYICTKVDIFQKLISRLNFIINI
jgi:hypothetical protein